MFKIENETDLHYKVQLSTLDGFMTMQQLLLDLVKTKILVKKKIGSCRKGYQKG